MNITLNQGIQGVDLSIVEAKLLDFLASKFLGIYASATVANPQSLHAGIAYFRVPERLLVEDYKKGTGGATQNPKMNLVKVPLDFEKFAKYEWETFDMARLESPVEGAFEAKIAGSLGLGMTAQLDAHFLSYAVNLATTLNQKTDMATPFDKYKWDDLQQLALTISDLNADLTGQVDMTMIGADDDKRDTITIAQPKLYSRLARSSARGGDISSHTLANGVMIGEMTDGLKIVKHHFLGKNFAKTDAKLKLDIDNNYDLSSTLALILHTEAIAMPFALNSLVPVINQENGNPRVIAKYNYGIKAVRESLIWAIKATATK